MSSNSHDEGVAHLQKAESCLKGGLMRRIFGGKPDFEGAASYYEKAALAFRKSSPDKAREAYEKAAQCQLDNNQLFHSGKSCQQVASLYKEKGDVEACLKWLDDAIARYLEGGYPETAIGALVQAAKIVEKTNPEAAAQRYKKAADIHQTEDHPARAADVLREIPRLFIQMERYDEAVTALQQEIKCNLDCGEQSRSQLTNRLVVCMVVLQLYRADRHGAERQLQLASAYPDFSNSPEQEGLTCLLDVVKQGDKETADDLLDQPMFKYIENEFSKLARSLRTRPPENLYPEAFDDDDLK